MSSNLLILLVAALGFVAVAGFTLVQQEPHRSPPEVLPGLADRREGDGRGLGEGDVVVPDDGQLPRHRPARRHRALQDAHVACFVQGVPTEPAQDIFNLI